MVWECGTLGGRDCVGMEPIVIRFFTALMVALSAIPAGGATCIGLTAPVDGMVQQGFAPTGRYSGHWGVDFAVTAGTPVRAAGPGVVSFTGTVAGNLTLTVDHGGGLRTSYSYLSGATARRGDLVTGSTVIGRSGPGHGPAALHFSVRVGTTYIDPLRVIGCHPVDPSQALRLVPHRDGR